MHWYFLKIHISSVIWKQTFLHLTYRFILLVKIAFLNIFFSSFRWSDDNDHDGLPAWPADRLRGLRRGLVRDRPAGRQAGRPQEAAQCVPEPCQL